MSIKKLYKDLVQNPYKYSYNQTCFILEEYFNNKCKFGEGNSSNEPIKLVPYNKFSSVQAECVSVNKYEAVINLNALTGVNGVLPRFYTENIIFKAKEKNSILSDFLNIFQHRFFCLQYKIDKNYEPTLNKKYEFNTIYKITGIFKNTLQNFLTPFLSILLNKSKTKMNLKMIVENLTNVETNIKEFQNQSFDIPAEYQLTLNYSTLKDKALGDYVKSSYAAIGIELLFQTFQEYIKYFHNKILQQKIYDLLKYYLNEQLDFKIIYKIKEFTTKTFKIDNQNSLGYTTWI